MQQVKINQVKQQEVRTQDTAETRRKRVELFTNSQVEGARATFSGIGKQDLSALSKTSTDQNATHERAEEEPIMVKFPDGTRQELPRISSDQRAQLQAFWATLDPEKRQELQTAAVELGAMAYDRVLDRRDEKGAALTTDKAMMDAGSQPSWEAYFATGYQEEQAKAEQSGIIAGLWGVEQNLYGFFDKMRANQNLASSVRTDAADVTEALATWPDDGSTELFSYTDLTINDDSSVSTTAYTDVELTKEEAKALLKRLELNIESLSTVTTMEGMELQRMTNKYQQASETISNILKLTYETQKNILQNVK